MHIIDPSFKNAIPAIQARDSLIMCDELSREEQESEDAEKSQYDIQPSDELSYQLRWLINLERRRIKSCYERNNGWSKHRA